MPEQFPERLTRFTPDAAGLDRDALLFAAGRASVRRNRGWAALAGLLAASQVVTLALLWPRPASPVGPADTGPTAFREVQLPGPSHPADAAELGVLNRRALQSPDDDLPPSGPVDGVIPSDPPLYAFGSPPPKGLE